jgi:small conductance mechanosensitive channel
MNRLSFAASSIGHIPHIASTLAVGSVELAFVGTLLAALYAIATLLIRRVAVLGGDADDSTRVLRSKTRHLFVAATVVIALGIVLYDGWLVSRGVDVKDHTVALLAAIGAGFWIGLAIALVKLAAAASLIVVVLRALRAALTWIEARLNRWDQLRDNDRSVTAFFVGLSQAVAVAAWMLLGVFALQLFQVPDIALTWALRVIRAYLVIAVGILIIRASAAIVETLEGFSHRYSQKRGWVHYYEHLRPLLPTFRASLEYVLWVLLGSLVLVQIRAGALAVWGPRVIESIGIYFLGCVVIELGHFEINRRLLFADRLDEMTRRRRETIAPLVRTAFTYGVYFTAAVLILASLGFNPMPFLAGAGVLGLVVGFGAQSLINDVVSGFFILFENTYLVGDSVEVGDAKGIVEDIEFRTTKIRDSDGRLHILRNGDVKQVVNYSKGYTLAVVPVRVSYDADLRTVCAVLQEAGRYVRERSDDVTGETEIEGIVAFGRSEMTVRTTTRVKPGRHEAAEAELRFAIKEAFDRCADGTGRLGLVPSGLAARTVLGARDRLERGAQVASIEGIRASRTQ